MTGGDCIFCIHLRPSKPGESLRCDAFPEALPLVIFTGKVSHEEPFKGDHGIQFEIDPQLL